MKELTEIGYRLAVYHLSLMISAMKAMIMSLNLLMKDEDRFELLLDFSDLRNKLDLTTIMKYQLNTKLQKEVKNFVMRRIV
jgi:hypothetical protein